MEWEAAELKKEEAPARIRGRMATHELARKQMAKEIARVQGRKRRDSRLEALERAAQAWRRKTADDELERRLKEREKIHEEFQRWQRGGEKAGPPAPEEGTLPKGTKAEAGIEGRSQDLGIAGWLQQGLARWAEENQPDQSRKEGRRANSAAMGVMLRRAVAREKALALGKPLPDPRVVALEQEAVRWKERKEEKKGLIRREIGMLQKLVQLMARDDVFDAFKKDGEWNIGPVGCLVEKVSQDGWSLVLIALDRSPFMLRWGWGDLLGVYLVELDAPLNLKNYSRVTPEELEEYLRTKN